MLGPVSRGAGQLDALKNLGSKTDATRDTEELAIAFFNTSKRRIPALPRRIMVSREFSCPAARHAGVDLIKAKAACGDDLTAHLSTAIVRHSDLDDRLFSDALLNHWGIYHFHLGVVPDPKNPDFMERTDDVLFARVTEDTFYMIAVMAHGNWSRQELLDIVHRNWPGSIERYLLGDAITVEKACSDVELAKLRKRINVITQLPDGTVYLPPGGGVTTSGVGIEVADRAGYYTHLVGRAAKYVREHAADLVRQAEERGHSLGPDLRFRFLAFMPGGYVRIIEEKSRLVFDFFLS